MKTNLILIVTAAVLAFFNGTNADDALKGFYPDVTDWYVGIPRNSEEHIVEYSESIVKDCREAIPTEHDENSPCFKICMLLEKELVFAYDYYSAWNPAIHNRSRRGILGLFKLKSNPKKFKTIKKTPKLLPNTRKITVHPAFAPRVIKELLGIEITAESPDNEIQMQNDITNIQSGFTNCLQFEFHTTNKPDEDDCMDLFPTYEQETLKLINCVEEALINNRKHDN